jgi:hypothetical protein
MVFIFIFRKIFRMKKILFSIVVLSAIAINMQAQFSMGIQAGASTSIPNYTTLPDAKSILFVQPGLVMNYQIAKLFSVRPGFNYLQTGYESIDLISAGNEIKNSLKVNNLQVPLDLCVPIKVGPGKFVLCAGPTLVFGLNGTSNIDSTYSGIATTPINKKITFGNNIGEFRQINWGTNFGLGYTFKSGLDMRAHYNLGGSNNINGKTSTTTNNVLSVLIGYYFIKPKK